MAYKAVLSDFFPYYSKIYFKWESKYQKDLALLLRQIYVLEK